MTAAWVWMVEPAGIANGLETGEQRLEQSTVYTGFLA